MCGLPAAGKSWLAIRLSDALRAVVLQSDTRRKVLARMRPTERVHEDYENGIYSPAMKERTYASLLENALETLDSGRPVIVDATFSKAAYRAPFLAAATSAGLPCYVVHVEAPESVILDRLEQRALDPHAISDADMDVFERLNKSFEAPDEAPLVAPVSGAGTPEEQASLVLDRMIEAQSG
jgi:predicted kinase